MAMHIFPWMVKCSCNFIVRVKVVKIQIQFGIQISSEFRKYLKIKKLLHFLPSPQSFKTPSWHAHASQGHVPKKHKLPRTQDSVGMES
jgi:hypothetical protein